MMEYVCVLFEDHDGIIDFMFWVNSLSTIFGEDEYVTVAV
jgi:hypothetical protein